MTTRVVALGLSLLLALPMVLGAAELPAAVDQLMARDMIQLAEEQLRVAGFDPGRVDGIFDERTEVALLAYQEKYGLLRTGMLDEATRRALLPGLETEGDEG